MTKDATILFMVKDQDYFGMSSQFLGEAYYPFLEIPSTTMETNLQEMQQIHLKLSKPTNFGKSLINLIVDTINKYVQTAGGSLNIYFGVITIRNSKRHFYVYSNNV